MSGDQRRSVFPEVLPLVATQHRRFSEGAKRAIAAFLGGKSSVPPNSLCHGTPLRDRPPAVDRETYARDIVVLDEKLHGVGNVLGRAAALQYRAGDRLLDLLRMD